MVYVIIIVNACLNVGCRRFTSATRGDAAVGNPYRNFLCCDRVDESPAPALEIHPTDGRESGRGTDRPTFLCLRPGLHLHKLEWNGPSSPVPTNIFANLARIKGNGASRLMEHLQRQMAC